MQTPLWIKPTLIGAVLGGILVSAAGFSWGGWLTTRSAQAMADQQSVAAIAGALTPYCVDRARADPMESTVLADLKASTNYGRAAIVAKAGWATPIGAEKPNNELAESCQLVLSADL